MKVDELMVEKGLKEPIIKSTRWTWDYQDILRINGQDVYTFKADITSHKDMLVPMVYDYMLKNGLDHNQRVRIERTSLVQFKQYGDDFIEANDGLCGITYQLVVRAYGDKEFADFKEEYLV
jgi:hypothetical protein